MKPITLIVLLLVSFSLSGQQISVGQQIFNLQDEHTHGATIVELPNGDLLSAWFQGNGERWSDDVTIMGARLLKDKENWSKPFLMADVPGFPDINPVLFLDTKEKLWLVWYTVIANLWETSLLKYRISSDYMQQEGPPDWQWQDVIHVKPGEPTERGIQPEDNFVKSIDDQFNKISKDLLKHNASMEHLEEWINFKTDILAKARGENMIRNGRITNATGKSENQQLGYPYFRRMGWQKKTKLFL